MRKIFILLCLLPVLSFAGERSFSSDLSAYQELCAKEQDPIKRHQYCQVLNQSDLIHPRLQNIRQDIALA